MQRSKVLITYAVFAAALLLACDFAGAQDHWRFSLFLKPEGIPYEMVRDIVEDSSGEIWAATWGDGLHNISALNRQEFHTGDGLPSEWITALALDSAGRLWVGTREGLCFVREGKIHLVTPALKPEFEKANYTVVRVFGGERLFVATEEGGVAFLDLRAESVAEFAWTVIATEASQRRFRPIDVAESWDGRFVLSYHRGVFEYDGSGWREVVEGGRRRLLASPPDEATPYIFGFHRALGTVSKFRGESFEMIGNVGKGVVSAAYSPGGELFVGTGVGLRVERGDTWQPIDLGTEVGEPRIRAMCFAENGRLWLGTEVGLVMGTPLTWIGNHATEDGMAVVQIVNDSVPRRPMLGIDEADRLIRYEDGVWKPLTSLETSKEYQGWQTFPPHDTVFGFDTVEIDEFSVTSGEQVNSLEFPRSDFINRQGLFRNSRGELWALTRDGAFFHTDGGWTPIPRDPSYTRKRIYWMREIKVDEYLAGTERGIERWVFGEKSDRAHVPQGVMPPVTTATMSSLDERALIVGTYGSGIHLYQEGVLGPYDPAGRFESSSILQVYQQEDGTLWAAFNHGGIASYHDGFWQTYFHEAGIPIQPVDSIHEDEQKNIWISTTYSGVLTFAPLIENPETYIDAGNDAIAFGETAVFTFSGKDAWDRTHPHDLLYSWRVTSRVDSADDYRWSTFEPRTTAVITGLSAGEHVFEVRTMDTERMVDTTPAQMTIQVNPPFWQRPAFVTPISMLGLLALGGLSLAARSRAQKLRAEVERDDRDALKKSVFENAVDGIITIDARGMIGDLNPAAVQIFGWEAAEVIGRNVNMLMPAPFAGEHDNYLRNYRDTGDARIIGIGREVEGLRKDGTTFPMELSVSETHLAGTQIFTGIVHDITKRKAAEEESRLQREQLVQAEKMAALGTLVAGVAHEINNPNTYVRSNAETFTKAWTQIAPILDEYYEESGDFSCGGLPYSVFREKASELGSAIIDGSDRIRSIVQELRDFALVTSSGVVEAIGINEVVLTATTLLASFVEKSTGRLSLDLGDNLPQVRGNFQRLEQVLINLLQNACQALSSRKDSVTISTAFHSERGDVVITIRDEGAGIEEKNLSQIESPFFTTNQDKGGTGLGLSISSSIVQEHGGTMTFESVVGVGTSVIVRLPAIGDTDENE